MYLSRVLKQCSAAHLPRHACRAFSVAPLGAQAKPSPEIPPVASTTTLGGSGSSSDSSERKPDNRAGWALGGAVALLVAWIAHARQSNKAREAVVEALMDEAPLVPTEITALRTSNAIPYVAPSTRAKASHHTHHLHLLHLPTCTCHSPHIWTQLIHRAAALAPAEGFTYREFRWLVQDTLAKHGKHEQLEQLVCAERSAATCSHPARP